MVGIEPAPRDGNHLRRAWATVFGFSGSRLCGDGWRLLAVMSGELLGIQPAPKPEQLQQVMAGADEQPLPVHFFQAP